MKTGKKKISIKDIAKELGISITTVSFVINGKAKNRISDKVIKDVEDYIEKVGYQPNDSARSLRTGKSNTIVFMAEDISDPFFSVIAKEMEGLAFKNGYKIIYCSTENNKERAIELLKFFKDKGVDAFIITPPEDFEKEAEELVKGKDLVMFFDRFYTHFDHHYIVLDNYHSTKTTVNSLRNKGFSSIGFVGLDSMLSPMVDRIQGYRDAVTDSKVLTIKFDKVGTKQGYNRMERFLLHENNLDAVIFATNSLAITGLRVLKNSGIQIPEELAVTTFDDRELFELYSPPISVISQPTKALAKELMKETITLLTGKKQPSGFIHKVLKGTFIPRGSTEKVPIVNK